jgi:hypothetical protein
MKKKKKLPLILLALIILGALVCLPIALLIFGIFFSYSHSLANNPAKKLAAIILPFAQEQHLEKMYEANNAADGIENNSNSFAYIYQGTQSMDELHELVKEVLEKEGYTIRDNLYTYDEECPPYTSGYTCDQEPQSRAQIEGSAKNDLQPYWVIEGWNSKKDSVFVEISNKTFRNDTDEGNWGENRVPPGKTVLSISFGSHECRGCDESNE